MIYKQKNIYIYLSMNLYAHHCEPREAKGNFYHRGWSLIVWSYTKFLNISFDLLHQEDKDYVPIFYFCFLLLLFIPLDLFFYI